MTLMRKPDLLIAVLLLLVVAATFAVYAGLGRADFVTFDDDEYVHENPMVMHGITREGLRAAFTTVHSHNWHPVTWISHMVDAELFGLAPGGHHGTSVVLHVLNVCLLYLLLLRSTGKPWPSLVVAALFALHPIQVETVAWISERKNVLSTTFWLLTMLAYVRYTRSADRGRGVAYVASLLFLAFGLMSKQMLVTLPCVLLLWDIWPLRRLDPRSIPDWRARAIEKLPFGAIAVGAAVLVYLIQSTSGVMKSAEEFTLGARVTNAALAWWVYVGKLLNPSQLACFYPHMGDAPTWIALAALLALGLVTGLALCRIERAPAIAVGWCWYLGTLVPVIGLVQVGVQGLADRYAYVTAIGLFAAVVYSVDAVLQSSRARRSCAVGVILLFAGLAAATQRQATTWRTSETLYAHAARVVPDNYWAFYNLGHVRLVAGDLGGAGDGFERSLAAKPDFVEARYNLAKLLADQGQFAAAEGHYARAVATRPQYAEARVNLAGLLVARGALAKAAVHYRAAIEANPSLAEAHAGLAYILLEQSDTEGGCRHARRAAALRPGWAFAAELLKRCE